MGNIEHGDENREADVSLDWMREDRDRWRSQAEASKADADGLRSQLRGAVSALERIAHHEREGDYAGQVNAMRAIATEALNHPGGQYEASPAPPRTQLTSEEDR